MGTHVPSPGAAVFAFIGPTFAGRKRGGRLGAEEADGAGSDTAGGTSQ
jgi:hypothetical protein